MRSFGSLGPFDYLAYRHGLCFLVQAKWSSLHATHPSSWIHDLVRLADCADTAGAIAVFQGVDDERHMVFYRWMDKTWVSFNPFKTTLP